MPLESDEVTGNRDVRQLRRRMNGDVANVDRFPVRRGVAQSFGIAGESRPAELAAIDINAKQEDRRIFACPTVEDVRIVGARKIPDDKFEFYRLIFLISTNDEDFFAIQTESSSVDRRGFRSFRFPIRQLGNQLARWELVEPWRPR